jgi:hypothetical protein
MPENTAAKPVYKKAWFWIVVIIGAFISFTILAGAIQALVGGSDSADGATQDGAASQQQISSEATAVPTTQVPGKGKLGDYEIEIVSAEFSSYKYDDEDVLFITYKWTNNSDKEAAFYLTFDDKVYQDGIECSSTISMSDKDNGLDLKVKPGKTQTLSRAYKLNDLITLVEVEVAEMFSWDDDEEKVIKYFKLK